MGRAKQIPSARKLIVTQLRTAQSETEKLSAEARLRAYDETASAPLVNAFAAAHGDYQRNMRHVVNRGGTALERWKRDGKLSESQQAAIIHCQRLWDKIGKPSRGLVADFNRVSGEGGKASGLTDLEAMLEMARIESNIPSKYWACFESVCRFDEPSGLAGSRLAEPDRTAEAVARLTVCFVADIITMRERLSY